jgi:peptidoglycan hydrolase-like protein with peptidoglycan-binding domain
MISKGNIVAGYEPPPMSEPPPPMLIPPPPQYDHGLVMRIQAELVRIGLLNGPPDGAYGPKTRGAIVDYEKLRGLPRDGIPSPGLLEDLRHN